MSMTDLNKIRQLIHNRLHVRWVFEGNIAAVTLQGKPFTGEHWTTDGGSAVHFSFDTHGLLVGRINAYNATTQTSSALADIEVFEEWLKKVTK